MGIDIGTSTTKMAASILTLENLASGARTPQIRFTSKRVIYRGSLHLTPLLPDNLIDCEEIVRMIEREYERAAISPKDVETGAVIITGEAAKRENARIVTERLGRFAGNFVVSAAGPDLESMLSGKGSGARDVSERDGITVVNFDIGGGTANVSAFCKGKAVGCACLDIGGRLIRFLPDTRVIDYIAPKLKLIAEKHSVFIEPGKEFTRESSRKLTALMAWALEELLCGGGELVESFTSQNSSAWPRGLTVDAISFSGGVGSCYYGKNRKNGGFHDIGLDLAEALRQSELTRGFRVIEPAETARATVIGAGCHTAQISGSTISFNKDVFPIHNLPVLRLVKLDENTLSESLSWLLRQQDCLNAAIALEGERNPCYAAVQKLSALLIKGAGKILESGLPLIVIVKYDFAKALGQSLNHKLGGEYPVVCLDGLDFDAADYIDLGKPLFDGAVIPVVLKTLIFSRERGDAV